MISSIAFADCGWVEDIACHQGPTALRLPKSLKGLRSIGELKSERITDSSYDYEYRELIYEGLRLKIETSKKDKNYFQICRVNITSSAWKTISDFHVGDTAESIEKRFNFRACKKGDWLDVHEDTEGIRFRISNGKVVEIEYSCFLG
jgi:hypothetical protein